LQIPNRIHLGYVFAISAGTPERNTSFVRTEGFDVFFGLTAVDFFIV
jgi:hypothetical protein